MTQSNNNYKPLTSQMVCSIRAIDSLPGELVFSLRERSASPVSIDRPYQLVSIWGDAFTIYTAPNNRGYKIRIFEKSNMVGLFEFNLLEDTRTDKTLGGTTDVYPEESFFDGFGIGAHSTSNAAPNPLHSLPEEDQLSL